jgi:hypothetical protein
LGVGGQIDIDKTDMQIYNDEQVSIANSIRIKFEDSTRHYHRVALLY